MTKADLAHLVKAFNDVIDQQLADRARLAALDTRLAAIETRAASPSVAWHGIHAPGQSYPIGCLVTRAGSLWLSIASAPGTSTPGSSDAWKLIVKQGTYREPVRLSA